MRQICDQYHVPGGGHNCLEEEGEEFRIQSKRQGRWVKAVNMSNLCREDAEWWGVRGQAFDDFGHRHRKIPHSQHFENGRVLGEGLEVYWKVPPLLPRQTCYDPARTVLPLLLAEDKALFQELGLENVPTHAFSGYT